MFAQNLSDGFRNPPQDARIRVWWHWMDGNISKDGIKKDLEWMHRSGIGGIHQFDAGGDMMGGGVSIVEKKPYMSDSWKDAFRYAIHLADSLGMEVAIASAPGWSSTGGPWVKPENAMKKLVWRTLEVTGDPKAKKPSVIALPEPFTTVGKFQNVGIASATEPWYRDVAVVAVKLPDEEKSMSELGATVTTSGGEFTLEMLTDGDLADGAMLPAQADGSDSWIQYGFPQPLTIRALTLVGADVRGQWAALPPTYKNLLQCSDDGINWSDVCRIPSGAVAQQTVTIPETTAKYFRLLFPSPLPDMTYAAYGITQAAARGTAVHEFVLHNVLRVNHAEEKAGFAAPHDLADYPTPVTDAPSLETVDLSAMMDADGTLTWKVPAGRWRIYRFGASRTGKQNHPAPPEATGLEVDKLDEAAWMDYFRKYMDMYKEAAGGMVGQRGIQYILTDSYEAGQMTWTRDMMREFKERRGYSLFPWLPALTGQILNSTEETERFLFDWRRTLGELFAENYNRLGDIAREAGMKGVYTESHENGHQFVGDGMDLKRGADIPMSAIWVHDTPAGSTIPMARADIRESASVAHVFGQNLVAAESFTASGAGGKTYSYCPETLKYTADVALSCGLNRFIIHESSSQPDDRHRPGLDLIGYGQWFNRHETWAEEAKVWTDYLARSSYLLQQGRYLADILYYYGEDNSITGLFGHKLPSMPDGYSYDFINPYGLLRAVFPIDGHLETESGMQYKLLVLGPNCQTMSYAVLERILYLAKAGVPICGTLPEKAAALNDHQEAFDMLVGQLKPLMMETSVEEALKQKGFEPDFIAPKDWAYVHRETDLEDIYWIRNFSGAASSSVILVRGGKGQPRVLDPATGKVRRINASTSPDGYRYFRLDLEENDALFVVIGKAPETAIPMGHPRKTPLLTLDGSWNLSFDSGLGAPATAVFDHLKSYTESTDPAIKYYSGTVTYRKNFTLGKRQVKGGGSYEIDLGSVKNLARVKVNGYDLGVAWKAPFRLEIPAEYLHQGINALEVKVINLWPNRIIGDMQPDATRKWTYVSSNWYTAESPLLPSGLLGPVTLSRVSE